MCVREEIAALDRIATSCAGKTLHAWPTSMTCSRLIHDAEQRARAREGHAEALQLCLGEYVREELHISGSVFQRLAIRELNKIRFMKEPCRSWIAHWMRADAQQPLGYARLPFDVPVVNSTAAVNNLTITYT